jgi:hypothetical protein
LAKLRHIGDQGGGGGAPTPLTLESSAARSAC